MKYYNDRTQWCTLATAILKQAVHDGDTVFLRSEWADAIVELAQRQTNINLAKLIVESKTKVLSFM